MATNVNVSISYKGGIFHKSIPKVVEDALIGEVLMKVDERMARPRQGKGLGAQRNTITRRRAGLELAVMSTRVWPRTTGKAWTKKNTAIVKSMAPRIIRKAAERVIAELT